mgnify:CR=1 FL=1
MLADIRFWEKKAQEGHFAIPHFNVWNAEMLMGVMDAAAFALVRDNNVPIIVCRMLGGDIRRAILGEQVGTIVHDC